MSKRIIYTAEPIGDTKPVVDFLPSPEDLSINQEQTKITISLSTESIQFFKAIARKHDTQYQKLIRQLLDEYVAKHKH